MISEEAFNSKKEEISKQITHYLQKQNSLLLKIRECFNQLKILFEEKNCKSYEFTQYCAEKWEYSQSYINQLINVSILANEISKANLPLPTSERQLCPLTNSKLLTEEKIEIWKNLSNLNHSTIQSQMIQEKVEEVYLQKERENMVQYCFYK